MRPALRLLLAAALVLLAPAARAADPSGEIVLLAYPGAFQDNYTKAVIEPFTAKYPGVKVIYAAGGNSAQMLGQLRAQKASPQVDVAIMDFSLSRVGNAEGLFAPLDRKEIPNLADVFDEARMGSAAAGEWGPGITFDHLVLLYGEGVKPAPLGIKDLMNPANKGSIVFSPAPNVIGTSVQILTAKYLGSDYKAPIDPVIDALKKIAANVQTWQATPDNYTMIINGAAGIGVGWNARAQFYADKSGGKVKSTVMTEGSVLDMDTINLVAGARNPAAAKAFIDFALGAEPQVKLAHMMYYGPTNRKAVLPPELLERTSSAPATLARMVPVDWGYVASVLDQWSGRWRREVIPAQ
ncbi:extracellular solute-binding protein [Limobrevibacterium gyesilva]|uniref:Extracellular solute-binding protein n=1 Tax=Limobrevibacterium gyesilva TaxID=2991712 RepID=A0AA42CDM7_9PROT|nr:extracellular solute-binding protein [Limobrevibacterium gyesilva]MCW3475053.1 extracellular solute-binding protein [Limobrevibacterium gyesilva]